MAEKDVQPTAIADAAITTTVDSLQASLDAEVAKIDGLADKYAARDALRAKARDINIQVAAMNKEIAAMETPDLIKLRRFKDTNEMAQRGVLPGGRIVR